MSRSTALGEQPRTARPDHVTLGARRAEQLTTPALALRWRDHGDRWARDALVDRFRPLARRLASRYANGAEPFEDLVQVASVGLVAAVDRFDPGRGAPFAAFAVPTILGELKRYFRDTGWAMHVARGDKEMAVRVTQAARELTERSGRDPGVDELAQYLEVSTEQVLAGLEISAAHFTSSLDAPVGGRDTEESEDGESLYACVGEVDGGYALVDTSLSLAAGMTCLPYLEREALRLRLSEDLKQSEIAERLGCSQMQVSRLQRRAASRLRELTDLDPELLRAPGGSPSRT